MRVPLHGKGNAVTRYQLWAAMIEMNPKGFRSAPTSRKNPAYHRKGATTKLEKLGKAAFT